MLVPDLFLVTADIDVPVRVVPRRHAMAPPDLAADAPVLDIAHPLEVGLRPVLGHEANVAVLHRLDGGPGQRLGPHEPLVGEIGFDHGMRSVAPRHHELVRLDLLDQILGLQIFDDALARFEAIEPTVTLRSLVVDPGVGRKDVDSIQPVPLAHLIIVEVVRRRDLEAAGAELRIDIVIGDDRDAPIGQRQRDLLTLQVTVAIVVRVNRNRGVTEHGLRPCRRDDDVPAAVRQRIPDVPQVTLFFFGQHLQIGYRCAQHGIPVDQTLAAIDQSFFIELNEGLADCLRAAVVHREALVLPVHRSAHAPELLRDGAAGDFLPFPDALDELFAPEILPRQPFGVDLAFHHHLRGDARVIAAGLPKCVAPLHAVIASECVHDRVLERVPHVQRARHVGRRDHDAVGLALTVGREVAARLPGFGPVRFDFFGAVGLLHVRSGFQAVSVRVGFVRCRIAGKQMRHRARVNLPDDRLARYRGTWFLYPDSAPMAVCGRRLTCRYLRRDPDCHPGLRIPRAPSLRVSLAARC